jgi:hypothetical protein
MSRDREILSYKLRVSNKLAGEPQERLLEVVVGLGRDVVVLEVLLAMESDGLGLDLALLHIDLVTAKNDGNVLANSDEITWNIVNHGFNTMGRGGTHGASWERSCR